MELQPAIDEPTERPRPTPEVDRRVWLDVTGPMLWYRQPLTPLGASVLRRAMLHLQRSLVRVSREPRDPRNLVGVFERRVWLNLSALRGYLSGASVCRWVGEVDPTLLGHLDDSNLPPTDDLRVPEVLPGLMFQGARVMASAVAGQLQPKRSAAAAALAWRQWKRVLERRADHPLDERGVVAWVDHLLAPTATVVADELVPRIALATTAARTLREPFAHRPDCAPLLDAVTRGVQGHRVSQFMGLDRAARAKQFAHWGPTALDVGKGGSGAWPEGLPEVAPRAFEQAFEQARQARLLAVSTLASELTGPIERARFLAAADVVDALGGFSDWPLDALLRCLVPIRRVLLAWGLDATASGRLEGRDWADLTLEEIDDLRAGRPVQSADDGALPGDDIRTLCPEASGVVVPGRFEGLVVDANTASPVPAVETIWRCEHLDLELAPKLVSCAGVLVARSGMHGPAAVVATTLGRPCVSVPASQLPEPGTRVRVDRSGRIQVIKAPAGANLRMAPGNPSPAGAAEPRAR